MHGDIVSNVRENLHYLDVSIFNHILSGRMIMYKMMLSDLDETLLIGQHVPVFNQGGYT